MSEPAVTEVAFERRYSDDSGVEFGVRYASHPYPGRVEFECVGKVQFPAEELQWLIDCLQRIQRDVSPPLPSVSPKGEMKE